MWGFILWVASVAVAYFVFEKLTFRFENRIARWGKKLFNYSGGGVGVSIFLGAVIITPALLSPLYYEFPNLGTSQVVTFEGDKIVYHPWGTFTMGKHYANVPKGDVAQLSGHVTFITENPKVRTVYYGVTAEIFDAEQYYKKDYRKRIASAGVSGFSEKALPGLSPNTVKQDVTILLASAEAEFNETHSRDLAKFWNQFSQDQQEEFKKFAEAWFNAKLSLDGIHTTVSRFAID